MKKCILCGSGDLFIPKHEAFNSVTSDCKPWTHGCNVLMCKSCGHVQKEFSPIWFDDVAEIYSGYSMYPLSMGHEQLKFCDSGKGDFRSSILLENMMAHVQLPESGKILDVGCGNGCLLEQYHKRRPGWKLYGHERGGRLEANLVSVMKDRCIYTGELSNIDESFDLIVLLHVLEHVVEPVSFLKTLRRKLNPDGYLLVHCPGYADNPFDLMVYDHCSNYSYETLLLAMQSSGFSVVCSTEGWIAKEIGFVCKRADTFDTSVNYDVDTSILDSKLNWLSRFLEKSRSVVRQGATGVFGTASAGTWLAYSVDGVSFFAEEDALQHGKKHVNLPIYSPKDVPGGASVLMAFVPKIAKKIVSRLKEQRPDVNFVIADE